MLQWTQWKESGRWIKMNLGVFFQFYFHTISHTVFPFSSSHHLFFHHGGFVWWWEMLRKNHLPTVNMDFGSSTRQEINFSKINTTYTKRWCWELLGQMIGDDDKNSDLSQRRTFLINNSILWLLPEFSKKVLRCNAGKIFVMFFYWMTISWRFAEKSSPTLWLNFN